MKSLLLADDDRDLEPLVRMMLKDRGFEIDAAYDGAGALAMMGKKRYSVVLLDLVMPGINGVEVVEHLLVHAPDTAKRVIILSAADPRMIRSFDHSLVGGVIVKPFDVETMRALVEQLAIIDN